MKKYITAILGIAVAMNFASCSKEESEDKNKEEEKVETSEYITEEYCYIPSTKEEKEETKEYAKQKKLAEKWEARAENLMDYFNMKVAKIYKPFKNLDYTKMGMDDQMKVQKQMEEAQKNLVNTVGPVFVKKMKKIEDGFNKECPDYSGSPEFQNALNMMKQIESMLTTMGSAPAVEASAPTDSIATK